MKQTEAIEHLRAFTFGLMKYRSVVRENIGNAELLAETWPWVFGDKCPLLALSKLLDRVESGTPLAPEDYFNMMTILNRFMPEVKLYVDTHLIAQGSEPIPEQTPLSLLCCGWD